jgi:DNA-binding transcriptional ArsR family regulator
MLRVRFTCDDLLRIRLAMSADPLWEIRLSLQALRMLTGGLLVDSWRREVRARMRHDRMLRTAWQVLAPLVPASGYVPDFLTPDDEGDCVATGIESVLDTPRYRLKSELALLADNHQLPAHILQLADGEAGALKTLGWALHAYHATAIAPYWSRIHKLARADRALRAETAVDNGTQQLLTGLDGTRWQSPVLAVDDPAERVVELDGRGLRLIPSLFCQAKPVMPADGTLPQVLVYAAGAPPVWGHCEDSGPAGRRDVRALLGPTRATILECLADRGRFTGELARIVATTPATVSKHTAVLRDSGLVVSDQNGRNVRHSLTRLGAALLNSFPEHCRHTENDRPHRAGGCEDRADGVRHQ